MALPILAQAIIGMVAPKVIGSIGAKNNWDPKFTSLLSLGAGFGIGAAGAGAFSGGSALGSFGSAAGASSATNNMVGSANAFRAAESTLNPISIFGNSAPASLPGIQNIGKIGTSGNINWASSGLAPRNVPSRWTAWGDIKSPAGLDSLAGVGQKYGNIPAGATYMQPPSTWDKLKAYGKTEDGQSFIKSAASTMVDGLFAQKPPVRRSGGGGGGGGGGPRAPAYPGGGGSGQKQVVWGFGNGGFNPQEIA